MKYILLFTLLTIVSCNEANLKQVKIALYDYPPISFQQEKDLGYCYSMVKEIFEAEGYKVSYEFFSPVKAVIATKENEIEAVCTMNPSSAKIYNLTQATKPNVQVSIALWARKNSNFKYTGIKSLKGQKIISVQGYDYSTADAPFQKYLNKNKAEFVTQVGAIQRSIKLINSTQADLIAIDKPHMQYFLKKMNMTDKLKVVGFLNSKSYGYFSIGKNNPRLKELMDVYNRGHNKLQQSGRFAEILKKYNIVPWSN